MTTSDQQQRTAAAWTDFELRFFAGADRMLGDYELTAGATYDPEASTTLSADVDQHEETSISVASTAGFTTGFIVIHPYAAGEAYEVIAYTGKTSNTFTGLTRYQSEPEARVHSSGATVSEWMEVTSYIYGNVSLSLNGEDDISDWIVNITGHSYLSTIFQPDRSVLCMWRFRPSSGSMSSWTDWLVGFIGFLQDVNIEGDWVQANKWSATVVSMAYYAKKTDIGSGVTYGKTDLAAGKSVEVSSYLQDVYQEAGTGEFLGTPSLSGDQAVDEDMGTLWISDGEPAPVVETTANDGGSINEVYVRPEPWMPDDLQWIELHFKWTQDQDPAGFGHCQIATSTTTWQQKSDWDPVAWIPLNNFIRLPETPPPAIGDDYFCIITSNKPAFMAYFPQCNVDVFDWRGYEVGTFTLDPTGDLICLRWFGAATWDIIWYDNGRPAWNLKDFVGAGSYYYSLPGTSYSGWTGAMIDLPPIGHTFRRDPTGTQTFDGHADGGSTPGVATDFLEDEDHPTPGAYITGDPEWIIVDLGTLGISLAAQLDQYYTVEAELDGHLGLTAGPGYVSVDTGGSTEVILYQSIDRINNKLIGLTRGQEGTSDVTHLEGAGVQQYEDGAATDLHLIETIRWKRRPVLIGGVYDVLKHFDVYSTIYDAGYPTPDAEEWDDGLGLGGWEDYWDRLASVRDYSQTAWQKTILEPIRARKVMIACTGMTAAGRVKMNSMNVFGPTGYVLTAGEEDGDWETGYTTPIIVHLLETWLTIDSSLITETAIGRQVYKVNVTRDKIANAIRELAASSGTVVHFRLDNTIEIDWDSLCSLSEWPDVEFYWTRSNARSIKFGRKTKTDVAQVIVKLTNTEEEETFTAEWPAEPFPIGEIIEESDSLIVGDADDAKSIAQMKFNIKRITDTVDITVKGIAEWVLPGQRHVVTFLVDGDSTYLSGHNVVVMSVRHSISLGKPDGKGKSWNTEISTRRVEYA